MSGRVRVAVIGAALSGRDHVRVLSQMRDVELAAVASLATPAVTHGTVTEALLSAGGDVLIENQLPIRQSWANG